MRQCYVRHSRKKYDRKLKHVTFPPLPALDAGYAAWDTIQERDMAPVMFVSLYFVMHILGIILFMSAGGLLLMWQMQAVGRLHFSR